MDKFNVKGFLDFGRLFKHLSKTERMKRKEGMGTSGETKQGEQVNNATPTKGGV